MNGFSRNFMGQVPLVARPGASTPVMVPTYAQQAPGCPPDTWRDENGWCRPRKTMGDNVLEYFDVPLGAFPVPWNMGCQPGEERSEDGVCKPKKQMGDVLEYFDVPLGAFPVPWNMSCPTGEHMTQNGVCVANKPKNQMGIIPGIAFGTVFEYKEDDPIEYYDVRLAGSGRRMGQEKPTCEKTAEGGYRCSDGTYLPPGCAAGSSQTVKAAPPSTSNAWPYVVGGLVAAGAVGAIAVLGRTSIGATAFESTYPEVYSKLNDYAARISSERASDAFNFQQYIAATKKHQDLVLSSKDAEAALATQEQRWEAAHQNADALQAAQTAVDQINGGLASSAADAQTYRTAIDTNQANISAYYSNAQDLIASLPAD